jgi:threonine/homoserine/homoserine lactone efflux protein
VGSALWKAIVFGAVVAGSIGPIALLIFGTSARQGFAAGAFAGLGAALADLVYALAAFWIGALLLPHVAAHETAIRVGCALLLVGLGASMLLNQLRAGDAPAVPQPAAGSLLPTFLLTIVNPMTLVVFAGIVPQLPVAGSFANAAWLALALFAGSLSVQCAIAGAGAALGSSLPGAEPRRAINVAAAIGILAFGIYGLFSAL